MADEKTVFVVIAEFSVASEKLDQFLAAAREDAASSLKYEPGCEQFDVLVAGKDPYEVVFYEVYTSQADFDAHLATRHLAAFREALELVEREAVNRRRV